MTPRLYDLVVDARGLARFRGRCFPCAVGLNGFSVEKREGDGAGLAGVFHFTAVYRRPDRAPPPGRPILRTDGWRHDPAAADYNRRVVRPKVDASSEPLWRSDRLYDRFLVTDANADPVRPGCGSALFVHVWRRPRYPTAGCIAFDRSDLDWIARRLTRRSRLVVRAGSPLRASG